jgi:NAD-dependent deacetylase
MDIPDDLIEYVKGARRVAVLSGAGISAESGLPLFRGEDGLWDNETIMRFATPEGFAANPMGAWEWYQHRRGEAGRAGPNPGHKALARWEEELASRGGWLEILTQNIDGLHQAAGSKRVTEMHGSGWILRCTECGRERTDRTLVFPKLPPRCPECEGIERPGVVWFGESLPEDALERAEWVARECDLFLTVGTSGVVYPAASFILMAVDCGAKTLEVNLDPTPLSGQVTWALHGPSGEILPALVKKAF